MGSTTIVVYGVLLALLLLVYWLVNKRDLFGRRGQRSPRSNSVLDVVGRVLKPSVAPQNRPVSEHQLGPVPDSEVAQAAAVLEDMYREFSERFAKMESELGSVKAHQDVLQQEKQAWLSRIAALEQRMEQTLVPVSHASEGPVQEPLLERVQPEAVMRETSLPQEEESFDARYLEVFDLLQQGHGPEAIANDLGVAVADVERVLRVMTGPPQELQ